MPTRFQTRLALSAAALAAVTGLPAFAAVTGGTGQQYLIQTTGATALSNFTSSSNNNGTILLGQPSLTLGASTYSLPPGSFGQSLGIRNLNSGPTLIEPPTTADRLVYSYHQTGSVNGVFDLAIRNGVLPGSPAPVSGSQPLFVQGIRIEASQPLNGSIGNGYDSYYDTVARNAPTARFFVPGTNTVAGNASYDFGPVGNANPGFDKPIPQIAYSDVRFEQAFAVGSQANARVGSRPTQDGYGLGQRPNAYSTAFNATSPNFQALAPVGNLDGGVAGSTTKLRNDALAVVPFTISANPGTGLSSITEEDARFLQVVGRLQNGANFNSSTRDVGSGTRNQAANNLRVDAAWSQGERDRIVPQGVSYTTVDPSGNTVTLVAGDEARPDTDRFGVLSSVNQNEYRPSAIASYADRVSGTSALRPTVSSQRMALGVLSVGDVGGRGRSTSATPLRVLAIDWEGADNADGVDAGPTQPTLENIVSGRYQMWSAAQAVTVRGTLATGVNAEGRAVGGTLLGGTNSPDTIFNDLDDDGSGTGAVRKFLNNVTGSASLTNFSGSTTIQDALTPLDSLIASGFIPLPLMQVDKDFDGDTQRVVARQALVDAAFAPAQPGETSDITNLRQALNVLRSNLNFTAPSQQFGSPNSQTYDVFDVGNTSSANAAGTLAGTGNIRIPLGQRLLIAGDLNGDGVRDLDDVEAWAEAFSNTTSFLAANPDIAPRAAVTINNGSIGGPGASVGGGLDTNGLSDQEFALLALTDLDGDGNVQVVGGLGVAGGVDRVNAITRKDVRFFLYGAAVDTQGQTIDIAKGQLKKNEAVRRFNQRLIQNGSPVGLLFDVFDVNNDGRSDLQDARVVNRNIGRDFRNLDDVLATTDDLVAAELTDNGVITFVTPGGIGSGNPRSDFNVIRDALVAKNAFVDADFNLDGRVTISDFAAVRGNFGRTDTATIGYGSGDANLDGRVTITDFSTLRSNFGRSVGTAPAAPLGEDTWDVEAVINWDTGEVELVGTGSIAGFEIISGSESLVAGRGETFGLDLFIDTASHFAFGTLGDALTFDGRLSLGNLFARFGGEDLEITLIGGFNSNYQPSLTFVPEPTAALAAAGLGGLLLRRRRGA